MIELLAIMEKNLKRLLRSKTSSLIIFLGPLILIAVIGMAFSSTGIYGIVVGVYSDDYTDEVNIIIEKLQYKEFSIKRFEFDQDCIDSVANGQTHICLVIPSEINDDNKIEFHIDYSRLNLVFSILDVLSGRLEEEGKSISFGLVYELINKIKFAASTIMDNAAVIEELKITADMLGVRIIDARSGIDGIDLDFDLGSINISGMKGDLSRNRNLLSLYEAKIDEQIRTNKKDLAAFEAEATDLKDFVDSQIEKKDNIKENLDQTFALQNCSLSTARDLTPYLEDSRQLSIQISSLSSPACSFIFTIKKNVDETGVELDSTSKQLEQLISDIDDAMAALNRFQRETNQTFWNAQLEIAKAEGQVNSTAMDFETARMRIIELNRSKANFSRELKEIGGIIDQSKTEFERIDSTMKSLLDNIGNVSIISPGSVVNPLSTEVKPLMSHNNTLDYYFPSLLVLIVMFVSILLSNSLVMKEKESRATFRNLIAPVQNYIFVLGTYLTTLILALIQVIIVAVIAVLFFSLHVMNNIAAVLFIVFLVITLFSSIGIIISNIFRSEETATIASITTACLMFLFSNLLVPIEKMSPQMAMLAKLTPFVISEFMLNKAMVFNKSIFLFWGDLIILIVQAAAMGALAILSFKLFKYQIEKE